MSITITRTFDNEAAAIAFLSGGAAASMTAASTGGKPAKPEKPAAPTVAKPDVEAAILKLKEKSGSNEAGRGVLEAVCGAPTKLADVPTDKYAAVIAAVEAAIKKIDDDAV